jgi:hypothetical protein
MSFFVTCVRNDSKINASHDIFLPNRSKYEVALVDFYLTRSMGYLSVYYEQNALFRIKIFECDSIQDINKRLELHSKKYPVLENPPQIYFHENQLTFDTRNNRVKFKLCETLKNVFDLDVVYIMKKTIEWKQSSFKSFICHVFCNIVSDQLVGKDHFKLIATLSNRSNQIFSPQYVEVERNDFDTINITLFDEKFLPFPIENFCYFRLHFRPKK